MSRTHLPFVLYIVLAVIASSSLRGDFLVAVLILLGGLAVKTWIGQQKQRGTVLGPEGSTTDPEIPREPRKPQE